MVCLAGVLLVASNGPQRERPSMKVRINPLAPYRGVVRRLFLLYKHTLGLMLGGLVSYVDRLPDYRRRWLRSAPSRTAAFFARLFLKRELRRQPFPVQLRRRLEMLGPTYVKLGQIMAIREDILPQDVTDELQHLLDRLPEVPFDTIQQIVEQELEAPLHELFLEFRQEPLGSASIGQTHRATTYHGKPVVVKVIKPGIRDTILSDIKLLQMLAVFLEWVIPQYQPQVILEEFCNYTEKEIDLTYEADHAELFAANFADFSPIVFPEIFRDLSTENVLCMEYFDGMKPNDPRIFDLSDADQEAIIDHGMGAIIKMLFEDGFFHADLHSGNVIVLPGPQLAFIDLGMVGRFSETIKRHMLYYFNALVSNDIDNAAKHLMAMARVGRNGDPVAFRRAVADLLRRYRVQAAHGRFSLAQLILSSLNLGGRYRIFFPVEMTLMVKSLVTFEGVGHHLNPRLDIPGLSRKHVLGIFRRRYSPERLGREIRRSIPELLDTMVQLPQLLSDGSRSLERFLNEDQPAPEKPRSTGMRSGVVSGAFILGGVFALVQVGNPAIWVPLISAGILVYWFGK